MIGTTELALLSFFTLLSLWLYWFAKDQNRWERDRQQEESNKAYYQEQNRKYSACPTKHANASLRTQRYDPPGGGGRSEVERIIAEDMKYGINRAYHHEVNCYGLLTWYCPDCNMTTPVTCVHGGSMYMCPKCYLACIEEIERKEQNQILETAGVGGH